MNKLPDNIKMPHKTWLIRQMGLSHNMRVPHGAHEAASHDVASQGHAVSHVGAV